MTHTRLGIWSTSTSFSAADRHAADTAARLLDELGFGTLWLGASEPDLALPEQLLGATSDLRVATGIVNIWVAPAAPLAARRHELAERFGDRFVLGLGMAHAANVEPTGQAYTRPYTKLVSYLDELDAADEPVPVGGRVLAALGPRAVALAGRRAAGAAPYLVTPEHTAASRDILGAGPLLSVEQKVVLDEDPQRGREVARASLAYYLRLPNYVANLRRLGFSEDDLTGGGSDRLVDALVARGDAPTVLERAVAHLDAGADEVALQVLTDTAGSRALPVEEWRRLADAARSRDTSLLRDDRVAPR